MECRTTRARPANPSRCGPRLAELGRSEDAITAAERLLTDENAASLPAGVAGGRLQVVLPLLRHQGTGGLDGPVRAGRGHGAAHRRGVPRGASPLDVHRRRGAVDARRDGASARRPLRRGMDVSHAGRELGQRSTAGPPSHAGSGGERRSQQWRAVVPRSPAVRAGGSGGIDGRSHKRHRAQPGGPAWLVLAVLVRRGPDRQLCGAAGSGRGRPSAGRHGLRTLGAHDSRRRRLGPQAAAPPGAARREPVHPHLPRLPAPTRDTLHLLAAEPRSDRRRLPRSRP